MHQAIQSQYLAALAMLEQAVTACPDDVWNNMETKNKFWHIAYHAVFYTHLYLQPSERDFKSWGKHREEYEFMGPLPWPPHKDPEIGEPFGKEDVLEYIHFCSGEVNRVVPLLDFDTPSGFNWLPFGKLELQFYNIRHLQQHIGELSERLDATAGIGTNWVGEGNNNET